MAWHWVEDKLLSDDEFKEHRNREGLGAIFSLVLPLIGWTAVCAGIGWLFPVWSEANVWFPLPLLLLVWWRTGIFEVIGSLVIITVFTVGLLGYLF